jgi:hypothetical protein
MDNLSIRYVFDRKRQSSETKQGLLQIEVRIMNTSVKTYISTGIRLYKNQFSDKNGFTCRNHPNAQLITGKAKRIFNKIEAFVNSLDCPSFEYVNNWDKDVSKIYSVVEFFESEIKRNKYTKEHYSQLARLKEFGKIKTFRDFTYDKILPLITEYNLHL